MPVDPCSVGIHSYLLAEDGDRCKYCGHHVPADPDRYFVRYSHGWYPRCLVSNCYKIAVLGRGIDRCRRH